MKFKFFPRLLAIVFLTSGLSATVGITAKAAASDPVGTTPSKVKVFATPGGFKFVESGKDVLVYNRDPIAAKGHPRAADGTHARGHYVHPIYDLDGVRMSDDMPADHVHHRGIFWAWTQLYVGDKRLGHPWEQRGLVWDVQDVKVSGDAHSSVLTATVIWRSPLYTNTIPTGTAVIASQKSAAAGSETPLVRETAVIRVHEAEANARLVDFDVSLLALVDTVSIGGSTDTKGYGGFSARIPLPRDMKILGPDGVVAPNLNLPSTPQPWVDFSGTFGEAEKTTGFAILVHPTHPGQPLGWTIRRSGSCQNLVFPGRELAPISTTTPMVLRYRTIMHRGGTEEAGIVKYFEAYAKLK